MPESLDFRRTEHSIRRWILLFSLVSLLLVAILSSTLFLRETYSRFEEEKHWIRQSHMESQQSMLQERVDNAVQVISKHREQAQARLGETVRERVDQAYTVAHALYQRYHGTISDEELQQMIVEALRAMSWREGDSYIWINRYDLQSVLLPRNPGQEGQSLADITDPSGNYVVRQQARTAREEGSGFNVDAFFKPEDPETFHAQISYVRDLGLWDWYIGSAEFLDRFRDELQQEILLTLAELRYGDNYIFIDTVDGHAILMNGELQDPPRYSWELEDAQGTKILQEQLRVARENPEGGFLSYVWHEKSLGRDMPHLSFVRLIPDWDWKIGTGAYLTDIEQFIAYREADLWKRTWLNIMTIGAVVLLIISAATLLAIFTNRRIRKLFSAMGQQIDTYYGQLRRMNCELEERVAEETRRCMEQERLLIQQTKMAEMGNMIGLIAHQWTQPLNALSLHMQDIEDQSQMGPVGAQAVSEHVESCNRLIAHMSDTVNSFKNYFKPDLHPVEFDLKQTLESAAAILKPRLRQSEILLQLPERSATLHGYHNEFKQVILNLFSNACDALEERRKAQGPFQASITVTLTQQSGLVQVEFRDNGIGIPAHVREGIFSPYCSTKGEAGMGIGLHMSRRIIEEKFHGHLVLGNATEGACFCIEIPVERPVS